jgi:uncharacterized protein YndB with AHSA1/START domain
VSERESVIEVYVDIAAPKATVFGFFSDPERFRRWMGDASAIEPSAGGGIEVAGPGGPSARGRILEWIEGERIVFSWTSPGVPEDAGSRVTVTFAASPVGTRVTLSHAGIPTEAGRTGHAAGWRHLLATLSLRVAAAQTEGRRDSIADASIAAWNERDRERRAALLDRAWTDELAFRDPYASVTGRAALDAHIAGVQAASPPGVRLVRAGPVDQCHGHLRFAWRAESPDGKAFATGTNFADLAPDGRLSRVVGFWDPQPRPESGPAGG